MRDHWKNVWNNLRSQRPEPSLSIDGAGFSVLLRDDVQVRVNWAEVLRIIAFKKDLLVVDSICLAFHGGDGMTVEVNEDIEGFLALVTALEQRFGIRASWVWDVALPAFATNRRELWARMSNDSAESS